MQIYKKGQGNKARAVAALSAIAIAAFGIVEAYGQFMPTYMIAFYVISAIMLFGVAGFGVYLSLVNTRVSEFLIETQAELKKVAWPPKAEVKGSTMVVIGTVVILGIFLWVVDFMLAGFMDIIQVYPTK